MFDAFYDKSRLYCFENKVIKLESTFFYCKSFKTKAVKV